MGVCGLVYGALYLACFGPFSLHFWMNTSLVRKYWFSIYYNKLAAWDGNCDVIWKRDVKRMKEFRREKTENHKNWRKLTKSKEIEPLTSSDTLAPLFYSISSFEFSQFIGIFLVVSNYSRTRLRQSDQVKIRRNAFWLCETCYANLWALHIWISHIDVIHVLNAIWCRAEPLTEMHFGKIDTTLLTVS